VFITRATKAEPLGFIYIPLVDLLVSESKLTQGSKSSIIHNVSYIVSAKDPSKKLGSL